MRYSIIFFILILFSCSSESKKEATTAMETLNCDEETAEAIKKIKSDSVQFVLINEFPRYKDELVEVLSELNIQLVLKTSMHGEGYCQKSIMDSVISQRFGSNFIAQIKNQSDSLFLESNRGSIFPEKQLDERPILAGNTNLNGQEVIIKRLNKNQFSNDSIELKSNIVNAPYFVVSFYVKVDGTSSNATITERNSTDGYGRLENIIMDEINRLNEWTPGNIRNERVSSEVEVAIAINE